MIMELYLIEYYDKEQACRIRYMNNSAFRSKEDAELEIGRIRKRDKGLREHRGYIKRTHFKIIKLIR